VNVRELKSSAEKKLIWLSMQNVPQEPQNTFNYTNAVNISTPKNHRNPEQNKTKIINIMKNVSSTSSFSLNEYYESASLLLLPHPPSRKVLFKQQRKGKKHESEQRKKKKSDVEMVKTHQIT
jgi:hypothetical protein